MKFSEFLNAKNYSQRTIRNYCSEIRFVFAYYNHKLPKLINQDDIIAYINYIKKHFGSGYDKCRMVAQALSCFYKHILQVPYVVPSSFYPRQEKKLPEILTVEEVVHLMATTENLKSRCVLGMFYGTGLRLEEMTHLKVTSICSKNNEVKVVQGKGNKDRITLLPEKLLPELRCYYSQYRPTTYLFEGRRSGAPMSNSAMQAIVRNAMQKAGFPKGKFTAHSLRHSFATHLLDSGVDIHTIKVLLGHSNIETTMVYLHLQKCKRAALVSPFDQLGDEPATA
ncbi:MAG: tyrosine-type recombinase/integrase [Pseudomonadota bacterium]